MKQLKTDEERKNFFQSEAAKAATQKYRNYPGSINSDGSFQVEEVPAGEYELTLQPNASMAFRPGQLPTAIVIYHSIRPIVIASPADPKGEFPHNCGTVELKEATIPVPNAAR